MKASPHVVVIGAGTLGMCSALNLVEEGARVTIIEAQSIASGSSGRSVGVVGTQFTDPFDILLRVHAMRRFRQWESLGLGFNHIGYLRLARTSEQMKLFARSVEMQKEAGLRSRLYHARQLRQLVPHISTEGLEVLDYRRDRLVLVTALTHPVSRRRIIPFDSTLEFDYVSLLEASAIHGFLTQAAKHKPLKIRIQVGNFEALCRMVERNVGVGVIPESVARRHVKTMAIRIIPLSDVWAERNLQICVRSFKLLPAFARELIDLLISDRTSDRISPGLRKNRTY